METQNGTPQIDEATQITNLRNKGVSEDMINFFIEKQRGGFKQAPFTSDNATFVDQHRRQVATPYSETQGALPDFLKSIINPITVELPKSVIALPNLVGGLMGSDALTAGTDNAIKWMDDNLAMYVSPQFNEGMLKLDEHGDLEFNDARSVINGLGQGIGSFLSMLIPGVGFEKMGMSAFGSVMAGATLTSVPMLYKAGKDAGLTNQQNAIMVSVLAPVIGALENVGGIEGKMLSKVMGKEATQEITEASKATLTASLRKLAQKGSVVTAQDFKATAVEALDGLRPILGRAFNKTTAKSTFGEMEEEYLQNIVQAGAEQIFDTFFADKSAVEGKGKYHSPENEILIKEGEGITGGSASLSPVDWIAKGMDMRYNKQSWKDDLGAAIYGGIIGHGLSAITTPVVNQSLYGYIENASTKAAQGAPRLYNQSGLPSSAGGQQAVQALAGMTGNLLKAGKITQEQAIQIGKTVNQMAETAHNLSGIEGMTPAISYDAYNAQYNLRPDYVKKVAGYDAMVQGVANMVKGLDAEGNPLVDEQGQPVAPNIVANAKAQKQLAESYDDYMRSKEMVAAIDGHLNSIVQGNLDSKGPKNILQIQKEIAKKKFDITKNPDMAEAMAGYTPKEQKKAQQPAPAVTISQLIGQPITMNGVPGTVAKDDKGVFVFQPEGETGGVPIGDKDVDAGPLGITFDSNIKPKGDAIQKPSTEKKVSPVGEGGENIPQDGGGVGQGKQGDEVAGADNAQNNAQKPAETPAEIPPVEVVAPKVEAVRDAEHDKNVLQSAINELPEDRRQELTPELMESLMKPDGSISVSALQRKFKLGYNKARDIADKFEADRLIPPAAKEIIEENKEVAQVVEGSKDAILNSLDTDKYIYVTHQTDEVGLQRILKEGFNIQQGLNGTTLFGNKESIASQIDDILNGAGHRGSTQMIIFAFPKSEFSKAKLQLDDISDAYIDKGIFALPASTIHAVFNGKINQEHENDINGIANDLLNNEQNAEEVEIILNAGLPLELEGELGARQDEGVDNGAGAGGIGEGGKQGAGKDKPNVNESGDKADVPNAEGGAPVNEVGEYAYHLTLRPFGIGTYPNENFVRWEDDGTRFGKIIYSKPVPIEDISHFSLNAITEAEALDGKIVEVDGGYEWNLELKKNEKREGRYYFEAVQLDEEGTEVDRQGMTTEEVIRNVQEGKWKIKEKTHAGKDEPNVNEIGAIGDGLDYVRNKFSESESGGKQLSDKESKILNKEVDRLIERAEKENGVKRNELKQATWKTNDGYTITEFFENGSGGTRIITPKGEEINLFDNKYKSQSGQKISYFPKAHKAVKATIPPAPSTIPAPSNIKAKWEKARKDGKYTEDTVEHTRHEPLTNVVFGAEGTSNFSEGPEAQNVPFRYALVVSEELAPTHKGVRENPENFIMEGQPKADVSAEALLARDVQNQKWAKQFNNTQQGPSGASPYDGFSNVNQRGEIFQGTGRWNILNHYYNTHKVPGSYEARIAYLKSIAPQLGLTAEQIDAFAKANIGRTIDVVKMYNVTDEQAIRLGQYDGSDKEAKVQGAKENQMAAKITPIVLSKIRDILAGGVTTGKRGLQILQEKAKAIIDQLVSDGVITAGEYQGYFDVNGNPQVSAITALQDILLRVAYPNSASLVSALPGPVRNAISKSLPFMVAVEDGKSITKAIDNAIKSYNEYVRETGGLLSMSASDWLNTVDSIRGKAKKETLTELEQEIVKLFAEGKENQIELHFRDYHTATVGSKELFDPSPPLSREQSVQKVFGVEYAENVKEGQKGIIRNESEIEKKRREIEERKAKLKNMGPKGTLTIDPEMLAEVVGLAVDYIELGYLKFADFVKQMYRDGLGAYAPYFKDAFKEASKADWKKGTRDGLSSDEEVDNTNVTELEKTIKNEQERAQQILEASRRRTQGLAEMRVESREEFNRANIGEGLETRPALRYSYEDFIPNVPISVENSQYPFMNRYQMRVVNLIMSAYKRGKPGFLLGDDTGTGKTATLLVTANEIALLEKAKGTNKRVLIVTMNKVIAEQRFAVDVAKINKVSPLQPVALTNGIVIATYDTVHKYTGEEFAAILYDESQELANINTGAYKEYKDMKTDFVVFASATPFQTPITSLYALARVTGATEEQVAHELGFAIGPDEFDQNKLVMLIPGGQDNEVKFFLQYADRLADLTKQFISDGVHIRRSYPFWGKTFEEDVSMAVPAQYTQMMNNVVQYYNVWIANIMNGVGYAKGKDAQWKKAEARKKGKQRMDNSEYLLEMAKVNKFLFKEIKDQLANGNSVVLATKFKGQVFSKKNPDIPKDGKYYQWVEGINPRGMAKGQYLPTATQLLKDWLVKEGISFGEITGNVSDSQRKKAMADFQSNKVHVVLLTMDSGGTGIDLDDQYGSEPIGDGLNLIKGRPRAMYITSQGWSASQLKQLLGRISRLTTKSASEIHFLRIPSAFAEGRYKIRSRMKNNILSALNDEADVDMAGNKEYMEAKQVEAIYRENKGKFANLAEAIADWNKARNAPNNMSVDEWEELIKKC